MVAGFIASLKVTVTMVLGHAPAAALGGAAETTVGGVLCLLDEPWSLHPVALIIRMISRIATNPIVKLLYLRMTVTLLLLLSFTVAGIFRLCSETNLG
jgi:hypothetical protein